MNGKDLKPGDVFKYNGDIWECTSNDGFMLDAENMDITSPVRSMSWIGSSSAHEVELVTHIDN